MLTVYSKEVCPYCVKAKNLLALKKIPFQEIDVVKNPDAREKLVSMGLRTVPQIFVNDQLFVEGGFEGLSKLKDEELQEKLTNYGINI
jgi:glutaredoxin 3